MDYTDSRRPRVNLLQDSENGSNAFGCFSTSFLMRRFIPISTDLEGMGVVSRVEVREQQIKQCMKEVDANPTSVDAWMNYVQLYGLFAEEAETKKERVDCDGMNGV